MLASSGAPAKVYRMHESGTSSGGGQRRVKVLLPLPLGAPYDYILPPALDAGPGAVVRVPLGTREVTGVVWVTAEAADTEIDPAKLKPVRAVMPVRPFTATLRHLIDWVAEYTVSAPGSVLRMAMSAPEAFDRPPLEKVFVLGDTVPPRTTPARQRVLDVAQDNVPRRSAELAEQAAVSSGVIKGLVDVGALVGREVPAERPFTIPQPDHGRQTLSPDQSTAAEDLTDRVARGIFSPVLLEGVTGSGKTAVYFDAVAEALRHDRAVLVLLPEIALTAQWLERFHDRFGAAPAQWHSELSRTERRRVWRAASEGRVPVLVGARSALFLPFENLGLIVVDEEHDPSFKQEEGVAYNARDMAIVRGQLEQCPVVLVSATPSLETVVNVAAHKFHHVMLPERHGGAQMPDLSVVDMRSEDLPSGQWISATLEQEVHRTIEAGEQALLFLNRRGYAPLTLCRACGHRFQCPNCQAWLVEHRHSSRLRCHHCDYAMAVPTACPSCEVTGKFAACGPGVERLAEEVAERIPEARVAVLASDTLTSPTRAAAMLASIENHEIDLLIGTQVIAKGFHFPLLTLVGVVDADLGLAGGDLRAAERTYQLMSQVAGRAGRESRPGRVFLQSHLPEHPVLTALASGQRQDFIDRELTARRDHGMPPYGRLVALIISSRSEDAARQTAAALRRAAPHYKQVRVLGPAPAPLALLRGRFRFRLLLKAEKSVAVQPIIRDWLVKVRIPGTVRVAVDVDPYGFL